MGLEMQMEIACYCGSKPSRKTHWTT